MLRHGFRYGRTAWTVAHRRWLAGFSFEQGGNGLTAARRTRYLFSGLIKRGECGGSYSMAHRDLFGCSTVKNKGTCSNHARVGRQERESRILEALRNHLMDPTLFQDFCEAYTREIDRARLEASASMLARREELKRVDRQIAKIINAIKEGYRTPAMKNELFELEDRKEHVNRELAHAEEPPALLHPHMAQAYRG